MPEHLFINDLKKIIKSRTFIFGRYLGMLWVCVCSVVLYKYLRLRLSQHSLKEFCCDFLLDNSGTLGFKKK